jgi:ABC-type branched-subunit amino acid transport system ATPase component
MAVVLETRNLAKRFGGIVAANAISIAIEKGARHALIGPNGAGKTTFVNLLTGQMRPSGGDILLDGVPITTLAPHRRVRLGIARTFQINQLFADLTPIETLGLAISECYGSGRDWWRIAGSPGAIKAELAEIMERFRLADVMNERTATLPYGKQRLLEIALALACRPRVLLLDEPAAGVPKAERHEILATHRSAAGRRYGATDRARHGHRVRVRRPHFGAGPSTVSERKMLRSCGTQPIPARARLSGASAVMSRPASLMAPPR